MFLPINAFFYEKKVYVCAKMMNFEIHLNTPIIFVLICGYLMAELHPLIEQYINNKCKPIRRGDNYNLKQFVKRFNTTLFAMAQGIQQQKKIYKKTVIQFLMHHYLLSDGAIKRYIDRIISLNVFQYDERTEIFTFPYQYQKLIEMEENNN